MPADDRELVQRCKDGRRDAYDELVRRHQDRVFNLVYRCVGSYEDASDIAQEVFIRAYRGIGGFQGEAAFTTWLHRIAINEVMSYRRRRMAKRRIKTVSMSQDNDESDGHGSSDPPDSSMEPSSRMDRKERERLIHDAIHSLDDEHMTVVVLKDIEGYRYEEIAEMIGCPKGTVKSRLHRARLELRDKLRPLLDVAEGQAAAAGELG